MNCRTTCERWNSPAGWDHDVLDLDAVMQEGYGLVECGVLQATVNSGQWVFTRYSILMSWPAKALLLGKCSILQFLVAVQDTWHAWWLVKCTAICSYLKMGTESIHVITQMKMKIIKLLSLSLSLSLLCARRFLLSCIYETWRRHFSCEAQGQ